MLVVVVAVLGVPMTIVEVVDVVAVLDRGVFDIVVGAVLVLFDGVFRNGVFRNGVFGLFFGHDVLGSLDIY